MSKLFYFRADANATVGTGHIMRCLSLAKALAEHGATCVFVCADTTMQLVIENAGFTCKVLQTPYDNMEQELPKLFDLLNQYKPCMLLIDSYCVNQAYLQALSNKVQTAYIDDWNLFDYPVNLVINYNIYAPTLLYPQNKRYLLGLQYAPLRAEFINLPQAKQSALQNVLLSTGGADPQNAAMQIITACLNAPSLQALRFHVIVGGINPHKEQLQLLAQKHTNVVLHQGVTRMAELMQMCQFAIAAAGSTMYELCACGVPTVCYTLADNQLLMAKAMHEKGIAHYAGDIRKSAQQVMNNIIKQLQAMQANDDSRVAVAENMLKIVDGKGAERLASKLLAEREE